MQPAECVIAGEVLTLWPHRALGWPAARTLYIADVHLGKPAAFAAAGVPVPCGTTERDLARLDACLSASAARRLVILGDLLHARGGCVDEALAGVAAWRAGRADLHVQLVRGNHDRSAGDPPAEWGFECLDEPVRDGPFILAHVPREEPGGYVLAGHVHPGVTLSGAGGWRERCPAFVMGPRVGVLPAFGSFTGAGRMALEPGSRVFVVGPGGVMETPVVQAPRRGLGRAR